MKKLTSLILVFTLAISIFEANIVTPMTANATASINIGDYVVMGKYCDEPILWRCVDIDENGPLMLSDKVLCFKAFDAKGDNEPSGSSHKRSTDTPGYGYSRHK